MPECSWKAQDTSVAEADSILGRVAGNEVTEVMGTRLPGLQTTVTALAFTLEDGMQRGDTI